MKRSPARAGFLHGLLHPFRASTPAEAREAIGYQLKPSDPHWHEYVGGRCFMCGAVDPWERS